ncbi:MAG: EF-hand domain-containing protein [Sphingomicrobium sp.]
MRKFLIVATALLAGTAALAQTAPVAQPAPAAPMANPMRDRVMTRDEVVTMVREHFSEMDTNKDGSVSSDEAMQGHRNMAGRMDHGPRGRDMMMHDGQRGDPNAAFDRLDANKNGSISRDEFAAAREQRIERRVEIKEGDKASNGNNRRRQAMRMHGPGGFGGRMIVMADTNADGRITQAEAEALALQHFDQMDANHDGQVTPEERRAARPLIIKQMREQRKAGS